MTGGQSLTFGALLRRYRRAAGLTQEELAERASLSVETISGLERGLSRSPHRESLALLADALSLTPEDRALFEATARRREDAAGISDSSMPPIIGRARELAVLDRFLAGRTAPVLLVAGEPGIGKTRLLREAALRGSASGWTVLHGGCSRRGVQSPYACMLEAIEHRVHARTPAQLREELRHCEWLVRLLPELADAGLPALPPSNLTPEEERRQVFAAVGRFLTNSAGAAGTLLILDDLQWAGADALDLVMAILLSPTATAVRLVGAYRSTDVASGDPLASTLADLARAGLATQVQLGALETGDARNLLHRLLAGEGDAHPEVVEQVLSRAGGVPFFLASYAQGIHVGATEGADPEDVPWDVAQTIRQRISVLPDGTSDLLAAVAAVGREVSRPTLIAVLARPDRPEDIVLDLLDATCRAQLLAAVGTDGYRFAHNVVRDVVWHDLGSATRATLHQRVAEALEQDGAHSTPELLAYHFGKCGDRDREIRYLERAGDRARSLYANGAAEEYYRELVERQDQINRPAQAARAREKLAEVLRVTARYDEALELLERAAQAYRRADDRSGYWQAVAQWGRVQARRGTPAIGIERIRALLRAAREEPASVGLVALRIALAELCYVNGQYAEQLSAAEQAAAQASTLHDDRLYTQAEQWRSTAMLFLGRSDEALPILKEVMFQSEELGDLSYHLYALNHVALAYIQRGEFAASAAYIDRGLEAARIRGDLVQSALMTYYRGVLNVHTGNWLRAREAFEQAVASVRQVATAWTSAYPLLGLGHLCLLEGQWDAAGRYLQEAIGVADRSGDLQALRNALAPLIERDLLEGRPKVARGRLDRLLGRSPDHAEEGTALILALQAWTQADLGELDEAHQTAARCEVRARSDHNQLALIEVLRVQSMLAAHDQEWSTAASLLDEALTLSRAMPCPYHEARVLYLSGLHAIATHEASTARKRLEDASRILNALGEHLYLEHIEPELERLASQA